MPEGGGAGRRHAGARGDAVEERPRTARRSTPAAISRPAQHRGKRRADPEPAARAARRQRGHRARRPGHRGRRGCSACIGSGPQIAAKCKQLVVAAGSFPGRASRSRRSRATSPRRGSCSPSGRRRSSRSASEVGDALPYPGGEHREGLRVVARASGRRRVSRVQADAVRRAGAGAGGGALRRASGRRLLQAVRARARSACSTMAGRGSRRRPDGKHRYLIVGPGAEGRVIDAVHGAWCPPPPAPRPGRGRGAAGMRRHAVAHRQSRRSR